MTAERATGRQRSRTRKLLEGFLGWGGLIVGFLVLAAPFAAAELSWGQQLRSAVVERLGDRPVLAVVVGLAMGASLPLAGRGIMFLPLPVTVRLVGTLAGAYVTLWVLSVLGPLERSPSGEGRAYREAMSGMMDAAWWGLILGLLGTHRWLVRLLVMGDRSGRTDRPADG